MLSRYVGSMSYEDMSGDVLRFMDEQGLGRAVVVGHSLGGKVAMTLALQVPAAPT